MDLETITTALRHMFQIFQKMDHLEINQTELSDKSKVGHGNSYVI